MNALFLLPTIPLIGGLLTLIYHFKKENTNLLTNVFILISFLLSLSLVSQINQPIYFYMPFLKLEHFDLILKLQIDNLAIIMLILVNFISFIIHRYATSYLISDVTQGRFMAQLSILTAAVSFLVLSGNLLTAFIGWQFVGISLYILLNHYHYDINANKAAKKKFIINRVGDLAFLIAVILCYIYYGNSDVQQISINNYQVVILNQLVSVNTLIVCLIFVAVMTKSAQFPFHVWLPDTMQAPTPVSAIMHAGVINSGGFLLARISGMVEMSHFASNLIFTVGMLTVISASFFMLTQSDVKKQLAYSTMGQMGFMIVQCGIWFYTAAIFHLIAHGFFKAFLFLGAGNNVKSSSKLNGSNDSKYGIGYLVLFFLIFSVYYFLFSTHLSTAYLISGIFISITLTEIFMEILKFKRDITIKIILILTIIFIFSAYRYFDHFIGNIIGFNNHPIQNGLNKYKITISFILLILQFLVWLRSYYSQFIPENVYLYFYHLSRNKLFIEEFYRKIFINPYRVIGDYFNRYVFRRSAGKMVFMCIIVFSIFCTYLGLVKANSLLPQLVIVINQVIFIFLIASANRAFKIRKINLYILLAQVNLINMGLFANKSTSASLALFQIINSLLIAIAMELIIRGKEAHLPNLQKSDNRLVLSGMYFTILIFLWIGIPGTASFVNEFNILYSLAHESLIFVTVAGLGFILLAVTILHALQDHVFNLKSSFLKTNIKLSITEHVFILLSIIINVFNGIYPSWLLSKLVVI